ncbi:sugar transferase [Gemmatimonas phototrophica]|uniref:sugar transferase n=1 Tax=Gemmatimonas phototrophica TaxID=1379270 RepID=UPI0009ED1545|nr:sugar transferase [Gemmatimonas phototrophica]
MAVPSRRKRHDQWQRSVDVLIAAGALLTLLPLLGVIALLVVLTDGHPVFFRQTRIGRFGQPFTLLKFRSMRTGSGSLVTVAGDSRITPIGSLLRRTKLDELPQLWNVLVGEMSIVGPRPEVPQFVATWPVLFHSISNLRPGLTDLASLALADEEQLLGRHRGEPDFYQQRLLPRKLAMARLYRRHRSLWLDGVLMAGTAVRILGARSLAANMIGMSLIERVRYEVPPRRHGWQAGLVA